MLRDHSMITSDFDLADYGVWAARDLRAGRVAAIALLEYDLSPSDRAAGVRLLSNEIDHGDSFAIGPEQVQNVLRALDCEFIARRRSTRPQ